VKNVTCFVVIFSVVRNPIYCIIPLQGLQYCYQECILRDTTPDLVCSYFSFMPCMIVLGFVKSLDPTH